MKEFEYIVRSPGKEDTVVLARSNGEAIERFHNLTGMPIRVIEKRCRVAKIFPGREKKADKKLKVQDVKNGIQSIDGGRY